MNINSQGIYLTPFQRQLLQESIKEELPNAHLQRLEIILLTDNGKTQAEICRILGCSTATASRWIQLTKAGLAHKYLDCPVGRPKIVTNEYIESLRGLLQGSPRDYGYPFKTWTISWLSKHLAKEIGIEVSVSHLKRVMRDLGLSTRSPSAQAKLSPSAQAKLSPSAQAKLSPSAQAKLSKTRQESCSLSSKNILIADLPGNLDYLQDEELSEINLLQIKLNFRIYD